MYRIHVCKPCFICAKGLQLPRQQQHSQNAHIILVSSVHGPANSLLLLCGIFETPPQNKTKPVQYNNLPGSHVFLSTQHLQIVCTDCLEITFHLRGGTKMGPVQQCGDYGIETLRHPELRCVLWIKLKLVCAHTCVVKF